jgi:hypothetical protein
MKEWLCIQIVNHKRVAKAIQEHEAKGWTLYSYQVAPYADRVSHFLLFEKTVHEDDYVS